ncbi:ABC transporter permease [Cohnella nanjingensis]|uniref:ABC transporter permease n=1 Tax=Cohnella nanjingensis TaxID=1387779 RepID=A0A7X0VJ87_9BACL|nr:ABC transporter permease [Cohnella nanjingensis]MBB6674454.1 ABC transporter permease [Cohnella nanjingensis]
MNSMWTVMSFTMRNKLRSKSFLITTIILAVLLVVGANVPYFIDKFTSGGSATKVGYITDEPGDLIKGLETYFGKQEKPQVQLVPIEAAGSAEADAAVLKQAIEDKTITGYLSFVTNDQAGFPDVTYHSKKMLDTDTSQALQAALQEVKTNQAVQDAKLTKEQLQKLFSPVKLNSVQISDSANGKTAEEQGTAIGLTYAIIILLFMAVMITGQLIATEITAEKSSRVMEIIVTSVSPLKQMFGKVLGTFIVGLVQLVVLVGATVVNLSLPHNADSFKNLGIRLDTIDPKMLIFAVVLYLLGYFLYAMLFAAIGSIVSRTEDLGQAVMPVTMLTLAGFYIAIFGLSHPDSPFIVACSYIPFFSPFILFLRIGLANPAWWEIALSVGILLVSVLVIGWLAAKIYRVGVLMYGKKPSFKEVFKAMKAYKV